LSENNIEAGEAQDKMKLAHKVRNV